MCKYAEQEGKEIKMIMPSGTIFEGIVIGCDPDVGITIVDKTDKDHYLLCAHGMSSPILKERVGNWAGFLNDPYFEADVQCLLDIVMSGIEKGVIDCDNFSRDQIGHDASKENCSFG